MKDLLDKNGFIEIQDGVYLNTKEHLISEQMDWDDEDKAKKIDFNEYPYWITTDNGFGPKGVETIKEGLMNVESV